MLDPREKQFDPLEKIFNAWGKIPCPMGAQTHGSMQTWDPRDLADSLMVKWYKSFQRQ